jgi:hypothetical protein
MRRLGLILVVSGLFAAGPAYAQFVPPPPELEGRIPQPLPPPPQPPIINGPLRQGPPPGVYRPGRIGGAGERASSCLHSGRGYGLRGADLDAYARACANSGN